MKAIVYHNYGPPDVLKYEDVEKPVPGDDQVLLRIRAAAVNPLDRTFEGKSLIVRMLTGLSKPKDPRLGRDVAGEVEVAGKNVTQFKPGDAVFGWCSGAFAEYACTREPALVTKPDNVSFEQAASVAVAATTALQGLRDKGKIQRGQKVLVNGAGGGVGTFAVQIAKSFGADVTAVCSTSKVDMVRSIGADHVIDYTQEDFTRGTQRYDLIFDCISNHSLLACRRVLNANGICVRAGGPKSIQGLAASALKVAALSRLGSRKFVTYLAHLSNQDLTTLRDLMAAGKVTPVVGRRYSLSKVPDAIRYLDQGHARGKIIITMGGDPETAEAGDTEARIDGGN